jgi:hypothetical protein
MLIQYASDLHVDDWPVKTPFESFLTPTSPFLILAGDICSAWNPRYFQFLAWAARMWHLVIFTTGNHEYQNRAKHTMAETEARIIEFCGKHKNLIYLQGGASFTIPRTRIRVVGATLWSAPDPAVWSKGKKKKSDYRSIYKSVDEGKRKRIHPSDVFALHTEHKAALAAALKPQAAGEVIVAVTHHLPTKLLLEPEYRGEEFHTFYASDDDDLFAPPVALWICGHSHRGTTLKTPQGTLLAMNARGYNRIGEQQRKHDPYSPAAVQKLI